MVVASREAKRKQLRVVLNEARRMKMRVVTIILPETVANYTEAG